jgi:hypothetical protein
MEARAAEREAGRQEGRQAGCRQTITQNLRKGLLLGSKVFGHAGKEAYGLRGRHAGRQA